MFERPAPSRSALGLAVVLLLAALPVGAIVAGEGDQAHLAPGPGTQLVGAQSVSSRPVCHFFMPYDVVPGPNDCPTVPLTNPESFFYTLHTVPYYDPATGTTVVVSNPAFVSLFNGLTGPAATQTTAPPCAPIDVYPGVGSGVLIGCIGTNFTVMLLTMNATTGAFGQNLTLPYGLLSPTAAWDQTRGLLYLDGASPGGSGEVQIVRVVGPTLEGVIPLPAGTDNTPLAFDPIHDAVIFSSPESNAIQELNVTTGAVATVLSNATASSLTLLPDGQTLDVGLNNQGQATVLCNLTGAGRPVDIPADSTTAALAIGPAGSLVLVGPNSVSAVDPRTGRVLYTSPTYYGIVVAGAATGTGPGDPILLGQEDRNGDPSVTVISLVANGTVGPAFGGVPVFGTMTPWAVTGAVAVIGLGLLILPGRRQWRRYRAWDDERQAAWWSRSSR